MLVAVYNWRDIGNPDAGGAENVLHRFMTNLNIRGHNVEWISANFNGNDNNREYKSNAYIIKRIGNKYTYWIMAKYKSFKDNGRYDFVIERMDDGAGFPLFFLKRKKVILVFHLFKKEIFTEYPRKLGILGYPIGIVAYLLTNKIAPIFYRNTPIITISEQTKDDLIKSGFNKKNIYVIQEGIDAYKYIPGNIKSKMPSLVIVSRLVKYKNIQDVIRATKIVANKIPNIMLHIIGRGDYEKTLRELIKELNLENNVILHGFISDEEKIRFLQESWALIMPSSKEGWATPVLEANACRTPAIASDAIGVKETVIHGETGFTYHLGDYKKMAEYIERLIVDVDLRESFTDNALIFAENYSWEKSENKFYRLIENLYENNKI